MPLPITAPGNTNTTQFTLDSSSSLGHNPPAPRGGKSGCWYSQATRCKFPHERLVEFPIELKLEFVFPSESGIGGCGCASASGSHLCSLEPCLTLLRQGISLAGVKAIGP